MEEKLWRQKSFFDSKKNIYSKINNNSDVCHIYYDITVFNDINNQSSNLGAIPCTFSQSRENPYLDTPEDYSVTVPYLKLESNNFPLQLVNPSYSDVINNGINTQYYVFFKGFSVLLPNNWFGFNIFWAPPDATLVSKYNSTSTTVQTIGVNNPYFFNYSYNYLLNLINNGIYTYISRNDNTIDIPYLSFNPLNNKFYITAPQSFDDQTGTYSIAMSEQLYSLFQGFSSTIIPVNTQVDGTAKIYKINIVRSPLNLVPNYTSLSTIPLTATSYWIKTEQNYSSVNIWNPVLSVVFIARNLNVVNTLEAKPYIYGVDLNPLGNNASVSNILFEVPLRMEANPSIYFDSVAEYKLTNLLGLVEASDLQIDVFWKDTFGNLNIFYLDVGSSLVMKLLFRKKAFNY